jgi:hypothetical protein
MENHRGPVCPEHGAYDMGMPDCPVCTDPEGCFPDGITPQAHYKALQEAYQRASLPDGITEQMHREAVQDAAAFKAIEARRVKDERFLKPEDDAVQYKWTIDHGAPPITFTATPEMALRILFAFPYGTTTMSVRNV